MSEKKNMSKLLLDQRNFWLSLFLKYFFLCGKYCSLSPVSYQRHSVSILTISTAAIWIEDVNSFHLQRGEVWMNLRKIVPSSISDWFVTGRNLVNKIYGWIQWMYKNNFLSFKKEAKRSTCMFVPSHVVECTHNA